MKLGFFSDIKGILFDYGGVIEDLERDSDLFKRGVVEIKKLLGGWNINIGVEPLIEMLRKGQKKYEKWYEQNNFREPDIVSLWTDFLLFEIKDRISGIINSERADSLSSIYEYYSYKRRVRVNIRSIIGKLYLAGYNLGIISNTMSISLIPERLRMFEISRFFTAITLSIGCGYRKPNPAIFNIALKEMDLKPDQTVLIGDTLSRDIFGGKKAGISRVILLKSRITDEKDSDFSEKVLPDKIINRLDEIFDLL